MLHKNNDEVVNQIYRTNDYKKFQTHYNSRHSLTPTSFNQMQLRQQQQQLIYPSNQQGLFVNVVDDC